MCRRSGVQRVAFRRSGVQERVNNSYGYLGCIGGYLYLMASNIDRLIANSVYSELNGINR